MQGVDQILNGLFLGVKGSLDLLGGQALLGQLVDAFLTLLIQFGQPLLKFAYQLIHFRLDHGHLGGGRSHIGLGHRFLDTEFNLGLLQLGFGFI